MAETNKREIEVPGALRGSVVLCSATGRSFTIQLSIVDEKLGFLQLAIGFGEKISVRVRDSGSVFVAVGLCTTSIQLRGVAEAEQIAELFGLQIEYPATVA